MLVESSRAAATTVEEDAMVEVMFVLVPDVCAYFFDGQMSAVAGQEETDRLSEPPGARNPPLNSL